MSDPRERPATTAPITESRLDLPLVHRGKVRDVYELDEATLLMVASDRVSAFDVVMRQPVPRKGEVLTMITAWWLEQLEPIVPHHLIAVDPDSIVARFPRLSGTRDQWARRSMLVRRTDPLLVECVVRGYISGSAWKEYEAKGTLAGEALAEGLRESDRLDPPVFSPATKAQEGHDENIAFDRMCEIVGSEQATHLRDLSFQIYAHGRDVAAQHGIILADTKFEFGLDEWGRIILIDEVMTPDSSRFWPEEHYRVGRSQPSLDKQPIRDWLDGLRDWDKSPPPPDLPPDVVSAASERYRHLFERLVGVPLDDYTPPLFGDNR